MTALFYTYGCLLTLDIPHGRPFLCTRHVSGGPVLSGVDFQKKAKIHRTRKKRAPECLVHWQGLWKTLKLLQLQDTITRLLQLGDTAIARFLTVEPIDHFHNVADMTVYRQHNSC